MGSFRSPGVQLQWRDAQHHLECLRQRRQEINLITYNKVVSSIKRQEHRALPWRHVLALTAAALTELPTPTLQPDVVTFTRCCSACHQGSAWSIALERSGAHRSDAVMVLELLRGNMPRWRRAAMILEKIEEQRLQLDEKHSATFITTLSRVSWNRAQAFLAELFIKSLRMDAVLFTTGTLQWSSSSSVLKELRHRCLRCDVFHFHVPMRWAPWRRATGLLELLMTEALQADVVSYTLAGGAGMSGGPGVQDHWQQAVQTMHVVLHRALRTDLTLRNTVLQSVAERKQWRLAVRLLQQQVQDGQHPDFFSYSEGISAQEAWRWASQIFGKIDTVDTIMVNSLMTEMPWTEALVIFGLLLAQGLRASIITMGAAIGSTMAPTAPTTPAIGSTVVSWVAALEVLDMAMRVQLKTQESTFNAAIGACEKGQLGTTPSDPTPSAP